MTTRFSFFLHPDHPETLVTPDWGFQEGAFCGGLLYKTSRTDYIFAGSACIAEKKNGVVRYYHQDHLGSGRVVTDQNGAEVARYKYGPFGATISHTGSDMRYKFTGKPEDAGTGLYYFGARYYDPEIGRFTTIDPIQSGYNWYSYCNNNPLKFIDPAGLREEESAWGESPSGADNNISEYNKDEHNPYTFGEQFDSNIDFGTNCIGYAMTPEGKGYIIDGGAIDNLRNRYFDVLDPTEEAQVGDRVLWYTDEEGGKYGEYGEFDFEVHAAIVTEVNEYGQVTEVAGKSGGWGIVNCHPDAPGYYQSFDGKPTQMVVL